MAGRGTAGRGRQQSGVTGSDCSEFGGKVPTVKGRCQQLRAEDRSCEQVPAVAGSGRQGGIGSCVLCSAKSFCREPILAVAPPRYILYAAYNSCVYCRLKTHP